MGGVRTSLTKRLRTADAPHRNTQHSDTHTNPLGVVHQEVDEDEEEMQGRAGAFGAVLGHSSSRGGVAKSLKQQLIEEASAGSSGNKKKKKKKQKQGG